jgi:hypothetical protein
VKNLAGVAECDKDIRRELERARIEVVEGPRSTHEVAASLTGKLGAFMFIRAWYYWVVSGPVPIEVARQLYADPVGVTDVRSGGDCACRPPETWADYFDAEGRQLCLDPDGSDERAYRGLVERGMLTADGLERNRWVRSNEERDAAAVRVIVDTYHVDTEVGLRIFADAIRGMTTTPAGGTQT